MEKRVYYSRPIINAILCDEKKTKKLRAIKDGWKRREKVYNYVVGVAREFGAKLTEDEIGVTAARAFNEFNL